MMKHPESAEWIAFLYGEMERERQSDFETHLTVCPDCCKRVERWRTAMEALDTVPVPKQEVRSGIAWSRVRWAIAAGVVLGIGFGLGRAGRVSEREVRERLDRVESQVAKVLATPRDSDWEQLVEGNLQRLRAEHAAWLGSFLAEYQASQEEERREWLRSLEWIENRQAMETSWLKQGLANLASSTGTGFEEAQSQMRWFATRLSAGDGVLENPGLGGARGTIQGKKMNSEGE